VTKQPIKPNQTQHIYLTKEQHLQGKVVWLVKDLEAWDTMCEWWSSSEFKAISEQNWLNRQRKALVHHYGADGHVCKTQRRVRYNISVFSLVFHINLFVTLDSMLQKKSTGAEPHYLDVWLPAHDDDEARAEKLVSNNIKCYA
jgi:hypothetical protein